MNGRPLVWLDNAATTQKPQAVIDRLKYFYEHENSNVHRAAHELAARGHRRLRRCSREGSGVSGSRVDQRDRLRARRHRGNQPGRPELGPAEHRHRRRDRDQLARAFTPTSCPGSNWRRKRVPGCESFRLMTTARSCWPSNGKLLGPRTRLVSVAHVSNALGTVTPVRQIVDMGHGAGAKVLVDGAQAVSHMRVNVRELDADWYVFLRAQALRPDRHRRALWQGGAVERGAAVAGRRQT